MVSLETKKEQLRADSKALAFLQKDLMEQAEQFMKQRKVLLQELIFIEEQPKDYILAQEERLVEDIRNGKLEVVVAGTNRRVNITKYAV